MILYSLLYYLFIILYTYNLTTSVTIVNLYHFLYASTLNIYLKNEKEKKKDIFELPPAYDLLILNEL